MGLTNAGRDLVSQAMIGEATTFFNNANARLGVGNSTTAFAATQTDLQGASTLRKAMDATYPTRATNVWTLRATFATTEANFAWQEVGVFNSASGATMLSRVVSSLGTKDSSAAFELTLTGTWAAA